MTKKRRGFDIDLDAGDGQQSESVPAQTAPAPALPQRRGPMASAIHETAGALRDRAMVEAQIRAENDALAHEHVRLKKLGLITDLIALDRIDATKLTRDRAQAADPEMADLLASVREIGLSNPIRIEAQPDGRYELVQGYRRLTAFRALLVETGDTARFGKIPATIMPRGDTLERLYRQMIDENLVRKDISLAEMAQMAIHYAADPGIAETEPVRVVAKLYGSASYAKRSHIRSFIAVIEALGPALLHATEIPRILGLGLAERLAKEPGVAEVIRAELQAVGATRSVRAELEVLRRYVREPGEYPEVRAPVLVPTPVPTSVLTPGPTSVSPPVPTPVLARTSGFAPPALATGTAKVSFQWHTPYGPAQCTAAAGRIELRLNRDFSLIDRTRLEAALQALLERLG